MAQGRIFFTGFPGFLGRRLLGALLASDAEGRVTALVEAHLLEAAREAAAAIDPERIEVLTGDIGDRRLGLSDEDYERLLAETTSAYHLAAVYDLAVPLEGARRVNVEGTGNVLELCARCERLDRLNYVSTAYVAGLRRGVVYEHELTEGQRFKNHYEATKYQAEVWVRAFVDRVPTTIYRPAIVVGDSRDGETQKFDGPYYMLRAVSLAERTGGPVVQFGRSAAPLNVVPVDFAVEAITAAAREPGALGQTLHLVDPDPLTAAEVLRLLSREYADREPSVRLPPRLSAEALRLGPLRRALAGAPRESLAYLNHPVRFDTRRATDVLAPHGLECPSLVDYVAPVVRFFRAHEHDRAFWPSHSGRPAVTPSSGA